jgi:hypothetical protein
VKFLLLATLLLADPGTRNPSLLKAIDQIDAGDLKTALMTLDEARTWPNNAPHDLVLLNLYTGLAHAGLRHNQRAIDSFRTALMLDSEVKLPPHVAPHIRSLWMTAGGKLGAPEELPPVGERSDAGAPAP